MDQIIKAILIACIFLIGLIAGYHIALLRIGLKSFDEEFEWEDDDGGELRGE